MADNPHVDGDSHQSLSNPADWDRAWKQHFEAYQGDRRHAYYIAAVRRRSERRMLEIAAGSFRDTAALNEWGFFCEGVDYSTESVEKAREMLPALSDRIKQMDATHMDYPDRTFDLTFHNGFWGYFDEAHISVLAAEQARVTSSRMVATIHNAHNSAFKEQFAVWGEKDPIYQIRFFLADEVEHLMRRFCKRVTVVPVGGGRVDGLISRGLGPNAIRCLYRFAGRLRRSIKDSERLMCIGEVDG